MTNTRLLLLYISQASPTTPTTAVAGNAPPQMPFVVEGACPKGCCAYGKWSSNEQIPLFAEPGSKTVVATIRMNEEVTAITGKVITNKPGLTKIMEPLSLGKLDLEPGDLLFTLFPDAERNYDAFWFRGKVYREGISGEATSEPDPFMTIHIMSRPTYEWWAKIRVSSGKVGWTNSASSFSEHADCVGGD